MDYRWIGNMNKLAMLDSTAVCDGKFVNISVVNRDEVNNISTSLSLEGTYKDIVQVFTLYHDDISARNTFGFSEVTPIESTVNINKLIGGTSSRSILGFSCALSLHSGHNYPSCRNTFARHCIL
jgi:alpha-L-arabinofuranosidase